MKFFLRILIFVLVVGGIIFLGSKTSTSRSNLIQKSTVPTTTPIPGKNSQKEIMYKNKSFAYEYFSVSNIEKLILIPNFKEKLSSLEIFQKNTCTNGINGGFYDTENNPLGGFMTDGMVLKNPVRNRLIDGFLWIKEAEVHVTLSEPQVGAKFFLQTGPLFLINGGVTKITIANDEYKRRSVAGITKKGTLVFLIIYNPEAVYEGPLLSDMPAIISILNVQASLDITDAVNLDGGGASAFISKERTLQEFSPVGSFLCVQ